MPKNLKGHIAICNWNDRGDKIIKELYSADPLVEITILTDVDIRNEDELLKNKEYIVLRQAQDEREGVMCLLPKICEIFEWFDWYQCNQVGL